MQPIVNDIPKTHYSAPYVCIGLRVIAITAFALSVIVLSAHLANHMGHINSISHFIPWQAAYYTALASLPLFAATFISCKKEEPVFQANDEKYRNVYKTLLQRHLETPNAPETKTFIQELKKKTRVREEPNPDDIFDDVKLEWYREARALPPNCWRIEDECEVLLIHSNIDTKVFWQHQDDEERKLILSTYPGIRHWPKIADVD